MQITAGGSLFRASSHVTPFEFHTFLGDIGLMPGILSLGYVPVVADSDLDTWLELTRHEIPDLELFELDDNTQPVPLRDRELRFPLLYFEPVELFPSLAGLDIGFDDEWRSDLIAGLDAGGIVATTFIELGLPGPLNDTDQMLVVWPIADPRTGDVSQFVLAIIDVGTLVSVNVSSDLLDGVAWRVEDVTEGSSVTRDGVWNSTFEFGGRDWRMSVEWADADTGLFSDAAAYPLFGGLIITALMVAVGRLLVSRMQARRDLETSESLNVGKDDFLASVSHRLRTPLTSVVGFSEVLRDSDTDLAGIDRRELVSTIAVQAIELGHLFDNLLIVSRGEHPPQFAPARVSLASEVHTVLDTIESARRAKIRVIESTPGVVAAGDPGLIRQILRNLIANATDHGDNVELSVIQDGFVARVLVADDGPGIPGDRAGGIFELYHHATDDHGQPDSMGVGLFVSRLLARRMSGDVVYRRTATQTWFEVSLPAIPEAVPTNGLRRGAAVPVN